MILYLFAICFAFDRSRIFIETIPVKLPPSIKPENKLSRSFKVHIKRWQTGDIAVSIDFIKARGVG